MAAWRTKMMTLDQWSALQQAFEELQMAKRGDPDMALFVKSEPGDETAAVYMTGAGIDLIERMFPGWENSPTPFGPNLSLLVGANDPWAHFGIVP